MATISRISWIVPLLLLITIAGIRPANSAENPGSPATEKSLAIAKHIKNLSSPSYKTRTEASQKLLQLGQSAIAPLSTAAETDNRELAARCVVILKAIYDGKETTAKTNAETALKKLGQSKYPAVAKQATDATRKPAPVARTVRGRFGNRVIIQNLGAAQIQIAVRQNVVRRVQARQIVREVTVKEKGKTISIKELLAPKREINIKVTEKVNGKDKITNIKVRTSAELRQKHPKLYETYKKNIRKARPGFQAANAANAAPAALPANFQIRGRNTSVTSSTVNGKRVMNIVENGQKIQINDEKGTNIIIRVTETVNGKAKSTEYKAKDVAELKKKHPAGAKIYEKYTKVNPLGVPFQAGRARNRAARFPAPPVRFRRVGNVANNVKAKVEIEKANKRLAAAIAKLGQLAAAKNTKPEDLKKVAEEIQMARENLEEASKVLK
jgi:hypothetical protein